MDRDLFWPIDQDNDPHWIVKGFFNYVYSDNEFIWVLPQLLKKYGCGLDDFYCAFPDLTDFDPECHFEGVIFGIWEWEVNVSEAIAFDYLKQACDKYVQLHPEAKQEIDILWDLFPIE